MAIFSVLQVSLRQPTGFPSLQGHLSSSDLVHPIYVLLVSASANDLARTFQPLSKEPPCELHVVNLRSMPVLVSGETRTSALILHRMAVDCSFTMPQSAATCQAGDGNVSNVLCPRCSNCDFKIVIFSAVVNFFLCSLFFHIHRHFTFSCIDIII